MEEKSSKGRSAPHSVLKTMWNYRFAAAVIVICALVALSITLAVNRDKQSNDAKLYPVTSSAFIGTDGKVTNFETTSVTYSSLCENGCSHIIDAAKGRSIICPRESSSGEFVCTPPGYDTHPDDNPDDAGNDKLEKPLMAASGTLALSPAEQQQWNEWAMKAIVQVVKWILAHFWYTCDTGMFCNRNLEVCTKGRLTLWAHVWDCKVTDVATGIPKEHRGEKTEDGACEHAVEGLRDKFILAGLPPPSLVC